MLVRLCLTQNDIDESLSDMSYKCPLEQALTRCIGSRVIVTSEHICFRNDNGVFYSYKMPDTLKMWLKKYSISRGEPFNCTFRLEQTVDKKAVAV